MSETRPALPAPRVVYWGTQPSPYVVERFNAVVAMGRVDLEAWFDSEREPDRSWEVEPTKWAFPYQFVGREGRGRVPLSELLQHRPDVLVCGYDRLHFAIGLLFARGAAKRIAVRCLPPSTLWSGRPRLYRKLGRRLVFRMVDGAKVSGAEALAFATQNGLPTERSWRVTQSVDLQHYRRAAQLSAVGRTAVRKRLGVEGCTFLYVGRLIREKGLDDLLEAYGKVRSIRPGICLLLVGDGADEPRLRARAASLPGVIFAGFLQPDELPDAYGAADVAVLPTLGDSHGLVVQEAMASGLPVICTSAAGDVGERIQEGVQGYVVPPSCPETLAARMAALASDPDLRQRMASAAKIQSERFSHSAYAYDFERFVNDLLSRPPRRTLVAVAALLLAKTSLIGLASFTKVRRRVAISSRNPTTHGRPGLADERSVSYE